jgi:Zn-dependent protease
MALETGSLTFGRLFGIPLRVHTSWFLIFVLVSWSLAAGYLPSEYPGWTATAYWLVGWLTSLLFFGSVVAHELGHAVVALREGVPVRSITLLIFGGVAQIGREPPTAGAEFRIAIAGPLVSLALGLGLSGLGVLASRAAWGAPAVYLGRINLLLAGFNLIPGFPLDGGRLLRAGLWAWGRNFRQATYAASRVGQVVAYGFVLIGVYQALSGRLIDGLWIAFIGWFLNNAAVGSWRQVALREVLRGARVEQVMKPAYTLVAPGLTLEQLVNQYVLGLGERRFLVAEPSGGGLAGMLTLHNIRAIPREDWPKTAVEQVMTPLEKLHCVGPRDDLAAVLERMVAEDVNQMPVLADGRLVGLVTREDLLRLIQARAELGI